MPNEIERLSSVTDAFVATNSASTSPKIPFGAAATGSIVVDAVAGGANALTWHAAFGPGDTPRPLNDAGSGVTTSIATNNAYALPSGVAGVPFLVAVTNAGTATFRMCVKG